MGLINAKNKVPEQQRVYQAAYNAHTRLWRINPRSPYLLTPYTIVLWGTAAATIYATCRRVYGKTTWFSD